MYGNTVGGTSGGLVHTKTLLYMRACVCVSVYVCVYVWVWVFAWVRACAGHLLIFQVQLPLTINPSVTTKKKNDTFKSHLALQTYKTDIETNFDPVICPPPPLPLPPLPPTKPLYSNGRDKGFRTTNDSQSPHPPSEGPSLRHH